MSIRTLRGIATKTAVAGLVLAAAGATTGVVAAAENADDNRPEVEAPADQAADGLQIAEDAKAEAEGEGEGDEDAQGEQAGGLPEDLPEKAVADEVLAVITTWEGDRGREFGEAVSEAAQVNRQDGAPEGEEEGGEGDLEESGAPEDAGSQADGVRQDGAHRP